MLHKLKTKCNGSCSPVHRLWKPYLKNYNLLFDYCPIFYPSCNCVLFFATLFLMCLPFVTFLYFFLAFICPGITDWGQCSVLVLLHIPTCELPTVITVHFCAAMCSSSTAVGASLTCINIEGKEKEGFTYIPLLCQKAQGFQLATFQSQNCVYRLLQSYLSWNTCHNYKQLLREKKCDVMTKSPGPNRLTPLQQTVNNAKVRAFSSQTWLTGLNADLDVGPLIRAETASRSVHSCVPRAEQDEQDSDLYQHQRSDRAHIW